jgi:hypothetical protein
VQLSFIYTTTHYHTHTHTHTQEEAEAKKVKEEKKAKKAAAKAKRKTDWAVGDKPFAMIGKGKNAGYVTVEVTKVTGMGVIVSVNGKNVMVDANKLYETNPSPAKSGGGSTRGGRGGARGGGRGGRVTGGSSTARGPAAKSGGRGGRGGARGGGRGGRGGRGQGNQTQRQETNNQTGGGNRNARRQGNQQQPRGKVRSGSERA